MAHFAELDENNIVLQVIVVHNNELVDDENQTVVDDLAVTQDQTVVVDRSVEEFDHLVAERDRPCLHLEDQVVVVEDAQAL